VRWRLIKRRIKTEAGTATLLGLACGTAVGLTSILFGGSAGVPLILLGSIATSMVLAAIIGASIPTALHALRLDPRIAAGPLSLTLTDMLATSIYLASATLFLVKS
jgi:magnesium transporter